MAQPDASIPQKLLKVRRLEMHDVTSYCDLRLEGLKSHPEAFGASWEDEYAKPAPWWAKRLETSTVFGGWIDDSPLLGVAGFHRNDSAKLRHKGVLWGMYVRPGARGSGLAASLWHRVIAHARTLVEEISLTVGASNPPPPPPSTTPGSDQYGLN